jgi:oxalate decarboxylase/phosphoglucose isomerase-like protein (cupin superfamily)
METAWGRKLVLPTQPGDLEIVGGRFCKFDGKTPMLVFESNGYELSLHVTKEMPGSLGKFAVVKRGEETFHISRVNGYQVLMSRQGKALSLFFSDMPEKELVEVAAKIL